MSKICANCHQPLGKCEQAEQDKLLTPEEKSVYKLYGTKGFAGYDIDGLLKAQLAKVKQLYVKWDRELVARARHNERKDNITWIPWADLTPRKQYFYLRKADQLKEILTGGE